MSENTGPVKERPRTENVTQLIEVLSTKAETPMLDQESPTKVFILKDFWPVFEVFQILGLFPCKKETDEKGAIHLKAIRWWIPVIKIFGLLTLLILPKEILLKHLISNSKEVSNYLNNYDNMLHSKNSARHSVSLFFGLVMIPVSGLSWALLRKRKELCALQETFSSPLNDKAKNGDNLVKKVKVYFLLITVLSLNIIVSFLLIFFLPLQKLLTTSDLIVLIAIGLLVKGDAMNLTVI